MKQFQKQFKGNILIIPLWGKFLTAEAKTDSGNKVTLESVKVI
jgi:hypothetical protein